MTDQHEELLSCPFCGGEAMIGDNNGAWYANCKECGAEGPWNSEYCAVKAVIDWNRRATNAYQQRIAALEAENVRLRGDQCGTCMLVAEAAIKHGRGRDRAVASDECRQVVDGVIGATPAQEVREDAVAEISWSIADPEWKLKMLCEPAIPCDVSLKLYATPQPAPDVRALVEALELSLRRWSSWSKEIATTPEFEGQQLEISKCRAVLEHHRQAQQGEHNG